jgi:hypothetical protein
MSELTENYTILPPPSHHAYNITPANIAPETWSGEQLEGLFRNFTMNDNGPYGAYRFSFRKKKVRRTLIDG